ncbi:MAG: phosphoribosylglycinamide formyltransferase [Candidatus Eutrophobiaceae bacterium]
MPLILADRLFADAASLFHDLGEVHFYESPVLPDDDLLARADALLIRSTTRIDAAALGECRPGFIGSATSGCDHVDLPFLQSRNIRFAHAPGCNAPAVVEYVLSCLALIAETRHVPLTHLTVGIIGCGQIGGRLYAWLRREGIPCFVNDPLLQERIDEGQIAPLPVSTAHHLRRHDFLSLHEIASRSDVVTLHVPFTAKGTHPTKGFINMDFLRRCHADASLINAARGAVVDETALLRHLSECPTFTAFLDVWQNEPHANPRLVQAAHIATAHISGYSKDARHRALKMLKRAYVRGDVQDTALPKIASPLPADPKRILRHYDVRKDDLLRHGADSAAEFMRLRKAYPLRKCYQETDRIRNAKAKNCKRLAILVSGGGSNMQAIINACKDGRIRATVTVAICSRFDAKALHIADREGIPHACINAHTHPDPQAHDQAMLALLNAAGAEFVALAGYLQKLGQSVLQSYPEKIVNVHPSLLPKYGGKGMYGIHVHRAALQDGAKESGATIHLVNEHYDEGRILRQEAVPVHSHDTPESLAQRVLEVEHRIYPDALADLLKHP